MQNNHAASAVCDLFAHGYSQKEIVRKLGINHAKVCQILVTEGLIQTEDAALYAQGKTVEEIAAILNKSVAAVKVRIPCSKGPYYADKPTANALRIRKHRSKSGI